MDFRSHFSYDFANIAYTRCEHVKSSFTECTRKISSLEMVYYMILYIEEGNSTHVLLSYGYYQCGYLHNY